MRSVAVGSGSGADDAFRQGSSPVRKSGLRRTLRGNDAQTQMPLRAHLIRRYHDRAVAAAKSPKTSANQAKKRRSAPIAKAERRVQILSAAREVFARRGYAQATIDDIVAQAGVARGTFYLYFEDKRAVLEALVDRFSNQLAMAIERIKTDDPSRPVAGQVQENIRSVIRVCLGERAMTKILLSDAGAVEPGLERKLAIFYDGVVQVLTESYRDGQALGIVADGEPRVLAYLSLGALKELLFQVVTLGLSEESAEVLTNQLFSFLCEGCLRVAPSASRRRSQRGGR